MSRVRKQARTRRVIARSIVASKEFARGLEEVRTNLPFNPDNNNWDYERGRCFGFIAPLDMPLRIGRKAETIFKHCSITLRFVGRELGRDTLARLAVTGELFAVKDVVA